MKYISPLEKYLSDHYQFRYNIVTGGLEFTGEKYDTQFQPLDAINLNSILRELSSVSLKTCKSALFELLLSDFSVKYDPFKYYLNSLVIWDQQTDYIQQLTDTVITTDNIYWQHCFKKWIVAMVGSLYDSTVVNQTVLVFCGSQGIGKTTWVLNLIPNKLKDYVFSGYLQPHNKDSILLLSECALINLDELEGLNKGEIDSLKEMITKPQIKVRRPYASSSEVLTRRASFAGSINSHEFLHDYSGNRRFLCFTVNNIQYKHKVDIEKVLAQALYLFQGGFQYWFDQAEIRKVNQQNEAYRVIDIEEELLLKWYKPCNYSNASKILTTAQILQLLYQNAGLSRTNRTLQKIGKILRANDFERIKHKGRYAYCLQQVIG